MSGLELSEITEDAAWPIFDSLTGSAMLMAAPVASVDEDVAELLLELVDFVEELIVEELEKLGWTQG